MAGTLTIRGLDDTVKQKLRILAATTGRSMEAEARDILGDAVKTPQPTANSPSKINFDHLRGISKGRFTTDEIMQMTRGE
jgi:plasmid stability protein